MLYEATSCIITSVFSFCAVLMHHFGVLVFGSNPLCSSNVIFVFYMSLGFFLSGILSHSFFFSLWCYVQTLWQTTYRSSRAWLKAQDEASSSSCITDQWEWIGRTTSNNKHINHPLHWNHICMHCPCHFYASHCVAGSSHAFWCHVGFVCFSVPVLNVDFVCFMVSIYFL